MSCACGHHHPAPAITGGQPAPLSWPMIALQGRLICHDTGQMMTALDLLPDHQALSRAEPGCLRFDIAQSEDPLIWTLSEIFTDADAFAAHQTRTADSAWGRGSTGLTRDFHRHDLHPAIRPEAASDHDALDRLLTLTFVTRAEAGLVRDLRRAGDLAVSLIAHADGLPVGHIALSPLQGDRPAYALAPLAVHPALQRRGLGRALIACALQAAGDRPVVVLGDPAYYSRSGFTPASLTSPHQGPALQIHGQLPRHTTITHAPAFSRLLSLSSS